MEKKMIVLNISNDVQNSINKLSISFGKTSFRLTKKRNSYCALKSQDDGEIYTFDTCYSFTSISDEICINIHTNIMNPHIMIELINSDNNVFNAVMKNSSAFTSIISEVIDAISQILTLSKNAEVCFQSVFQIVISKNIKNEFRKYLSNLDDTIDDMQSSIEEKTNSLEYEIELIEKELEEIRNEFDKSSNLKLTEKYVNKINSLSVLRSELTNVIKKIYESNPLPIWNNN